MKEEIINENYRKLLYFFEKKLKVHFKDSEEIFYNGLILKLDKEQSILILEERVRGIMPILLEKINGNTISQFKERTE